VFSGAVATTVRARRAEAGLRAPPGVLLIGLAVLIQRFGTHPVEGGTLLSRATEGALGRGLLLFSGGDVNALVPLFIGFFLCRAG
jgi:hypothetical protein